MKFRRPKMAPYALALGVVAAGTLCHVPIGPYHKAAPSRVAAYAEKSPFILAVDDGSPRSGDEDDGTPAWPQTDIHRPPTDLTCDKMFDDGDYAEAVPVCEATVRGYRVIIAQAKTEELEPTVAHPGTSAGPLTLHFLVQEFKYDEAYTDWQVAFAKSQLSAKGHKDGHASAESAYALYVSVHDEYWTKINAAIGRPAKNHGPIDTTRLSARQLEKANDALTGDEGDLAAQFVSLLMRVHSLYPDVFSAEARIQAQADRDDIQNGDNPGAGNPTPSLNTSGPKV
jgi:hypothetical protein